MSLAYDDLTNAVDFINENEFKVVVHWSFVLLPLTVLIEISQKTTLPIYARRTQLISAIYDTYRINVMNYASSFVFYYTEPYYDAVLFVGLLTF